jgi:hypothetical protein
LHRPAHDAAAEQIDDHGQEEPTLAGWNLRDVAGPRLVGRSDGEVAVQVLDAAAILWPDSTSRTASCLNVFAKSPIRLREALPEVLENVNENLTPRMRNRRGARVRGLVGAATEPAFNRWQGEAVWNQQAR